MDGVNVVIAPPHVHKVCGIATNSECIHRGIDVHTYANNGIATYSELNAEDMIPREGYWYLAEDYILDTERVITPEGALHICLNGHNMKNVRFADTINRVVITNCSDVEPTVEIEAGKYLFENISASIGTTKGTIHLISDGIFNANSDMSSEHRYYNLAMTQKSVGVSNIPVIKEEMPSTLAIRKKILISSVSITDYDVDDTLIDTNTQI